MNLKLSIKHTELLNEINKIFIPIKIKYYDMAKVALDLSQFKSAGVYTVEVLAVVNV